MDTKGDIGDIRTQKWHIPRPSLSGSSTSGSVSDRTRGSASSQGSSSNHSTHSVSSGSMLLSAAYLERLHGRGPAPDSPPHPTPYSGSSYGRKPNGFSESVVTIPEESKDLADSFWNGVKRGTSTGQDVASIASSTHFTEVNGFTKRCSSKQPKTCCCDHSHQITVLVISMTILLSACILAAVCFVEMRMRKETGIYKYS